MGSHPAATSATPSTTSDTAIISMSDVEATEQPQGHLEPLPDAPSDTRVVYNADLPRGGRRKAPRPPKSGPGNNNNDRQRGVDHWTDIQELRGRLAEHEETMAKLKSAFAMISVALDLGLPDALPQWQPWQGVDAPAHRPPRVTSRRGGANCVNTSHYKNNNRGGGFNPGGANPGSGGYRGGRGNSPGFRPPQ